MANEYTAKKVLLKNTAGEYLIPYTEPIKWGEITGTLSNQTDLNTALSEKQGTISDLETIRSNATAGKAASDTISGYGNIVTHNVAEFATAAQGTLANTALQPNDNVSELTNDAGYITSAYHDDTKQDVLTAGSNIQITNNTISATDTTYTAGNGLTLTGTEFSANVINNVTSTSTTDALSANMGKELQDEIDNLKTRGRYLSQWDATTGLAATSPTTLPYTYKAGDYFIVGTVGETNYKPTGNEYTGVASTTVETLTIAIEDVYYYDGNVWHLQQNAQRTVSFASLVGQPTDNTNLAAALNAKQDTLTAGDNIQITNNTISATDTTYTAGDGISIVDNVITNTQTSAEWGKITGTLSEQTDLNTALAGKQATISDLETIRSNATAGKAASDTISGYGDIVTHNVAEFATAAQGTLADSALQPNDNISELNNDSGYITGITSSDVTTALGYTPYNSTNPSGYQTASDVATAISGKQDKLTAGANITIDENNVISATGQIATSWGSITGTLSDQTDLQNALDAKQNILTAGNNITISGNTISATDTTYTAGTGIDITNNVISNTQTSAEWGNITGTLSNQTDLQTALNAKYDASNPSGYQTASEVATAISAHNTATDAHEDIREKIKDIELFKFPNAVIIGSPTIQAGQVSNFSSTNYMQFPFVVDVRNKPFEIDFCFTTGSAVTAQQNILDSNYGLALAIQNGKGLMALSSNGTSWDIGSVTGTMEIAANTTYYAKLTWDGTIYKTSLSTDGETYVDDMVASSTAGLFPTTMFIGGCSGSVIGHTAHPFKGIINMNKCYLYVASLLVWQGMDDAGLATRADVSLSNLDVEGEARFAAKQDTLTAGTNISIVDNVVGTSAATVVFKDWRV